MFALAAAITVYVSGANLDAAALSEGLRPAVVVVEGKREGGAAVQGSGVVVAPGAVLTVAHVAVGIEELRVRFFDGKEYRAELVTADAALDVALLRFVGEAPAIAPVGYPGNLAMGSPLLAITAPRGLEATAVAGIVSNTERTYGGMPVIQTDLPFSPGSSGGPVFDSEGRLIGLVLGRLEAVAGATIINPVYNAYDLLATIDVAVPGGAPDGSIIPAAEVNANELAAVRAYNTGVGADVSAEKAEAYRKAVELLPQFFEAWFNLGVALTAVDGAGAVAAYEKARTLRPESRETLANLGRVLLGREDSAAAVEVFRAAVALDGADPSAHNDLGEALRRGGDLEHARDAFAKAVELRAEYAPAHYNLALTLAELGETGAAIAAFEAYLRLRPDAADADEVRSWVERLKGGQ